LEGMAENMVPKPFQGGRLVVPVALRAVALLPCVPSRELATAAAGESEVDDRPLCPGLVIECQRAMPLGAPPLGGYSNDPADLRRDDAAGRRVAFPGPALLRRGLGGPGTDSDGPALAVLIGMPQDALELLVDLPADRG